jgi:hypothetical protein
MLTNIVIDRFLDLFPVLYYGKIWNRLKMRTPVRPAGEDDGPASIAWVSLSFEPNVPPDLLGIVYTIPGGRPIYWPLQEDGEAEDISDMRYILNANVLKSSVNGWLAYEKLGALGERATPEDQLFAAVALYSEKDADRTLGTVATFG